jgi:hypothetical protein
MAAPMFLRIKSSILLLSTQKKKKILSTINSGKRDDIIKKFLLKMNKDSERGW